MAGVGASESVLTERDRQVLQEVCREVGLPSDVIEQMLVAEHHVYGMGRRHGIWEELESLVEEGAGQLGGMRCHEEMTDED